MARCVIAAQRFERNDDTPLLRSVCSIVDWRLIARNGYMHRADACATKALHLDRLRLRCARCASYCHEGIGDLQHGADCLQSISGACFTQGRELGAWLWL